MTWLGSILFRISWILDPIGSKFVSRAEPGYRIFEPPGLWSMNPMVRDWSGIWETVPAYFGQYRKRVYFSVDMWNFLLSLTAEKWFAEYWWIYISISSTLVALLTDRNGCFHRKDDGRLWWATLVQGLAKMYYFIQIVQGDGQVFYSPCKYVVKFVNKWCVWWWWQCSIREGFCSLLILLN